MQLKIGVLIVFAMFCARVGLADGYTVIPPSQIDRVVAEEMRRGSIAEVSLDNEVQIASVDVKDGELGEKVIISFNLDEVRVSLAILLDDIFDVISADNLSDTIVLAALSGTQSQDVPLYPTSMDEKGETLLLSGTLSKADGSSVKITLSLNEATVGLGTSELTLNGDILNISGILGTKTYDQLKTALTKHPEITTLELHNVPGSVNDDVNMHTARLVRAARLTTLIPADGRVASGGVDMFAAGLKRIVVKGAALGIHSWCCSDDGPVEDLRHDHPDHAQQIAYFSEMMGPKKGPDFYFQTLNAAPADEIHIMSLEEIKKSGLATEIR